MKRKLLMLGGVDLVAILGCYVAVTLFAYALGQA